MLCGLRGVGHGSVRVGGGLIGCEGGVRVRRDLTQAAYFAQIALPVARNAGKLKRPGATNSALGSLDTKL